MPPGLALILCIAFILYLFKCDNRTEEKTSAAVWIPIIWLSLLGSRPVSLWLNLGAQITVDQLGEGSPIDATVSALLSLASLFVLWKRRIPWGQVIRRNPLLSAFFLFCAISVVWSDFPFVAFKRWIKGLGDPLMAMVLLSEAAPGKAIGKTIKRCAYILIPLSIVLIKYYPEFGRSYDVWTGTASYTGVTTNKNGLGYLLFVFGLYYVSAVFGRGGRERFAGKRKDLIIVILFMLMIAYLFKMTDSKTPLLALLIGGTVVLGSRFKFVRAHLVGIIIVCAVLQMLFPLTDGILASAGRDTSLTGRTDLWESALQLRVNNWIGAGYESFWLGDRIKILWDQWNFQPVQAHNGYIEIFLNLGAIGVILFLAAFCGTFRRVRKKLMSSGIDSDGFADTNYLVFALFGTGFLVAYALYNVTEAMFKAMNMMFIIFLLLAIEYPRSNDRALSNQDRLPLQD